LRISSKKMKRSWRWLLPMALGVLALSLVALPSWRAAQANLRLAEAMESEMDELAEWAEVSGSIRDLVASRGESIDERWARLFPEGKGMDILFLDLARIADDCRVGDFQLAEIVDGDWESELEEDWESEDMDEETDDDLDEVLASATELSRYRIRTSFRADLGSTAKFLAGLKSIPRAMKIRSIEIREAGKGLLVEMEMELYVSTPTSS